MDQVLFQSFIDVEKWDAARWRATAFVHDPTGVKPPCLGILFDDIEVGKQIFSGWLERLGNIDEYEELRISIVEGNILGNGSAYSVHISSDASHSEERARANGFHLEVGTAMVVGRVHRMTTEHRSPHLHQFKREFAKHKRYFVIPVSTDVAPQFEFAIAKAEINFRHAFEISEHDVDAVVFPEHYFDADSTIQ
jgi:hypothetical protein